MKEIFSENIGPLFSPDDQKHGFLRQPEQQLTPESEAPELIEALLQDNRSIEAEQNRQEFAEKRAKGELAYISKCGDAREVTPNPNRTYVDNRIAAAINPTIAEGAFNSPSVQFAMIIPHYDGGTFIAGQTPSGCGGQGAKAEIARNGRQDEDDALETFIQDRVRHPDFIVNTLALGRELASKAERAQPVIVAPQDHRTGEIRPLAVFQRERGILSTIMPEEFDLPLDGQYRPELLYKDGIPFMDRDNLPDSVQEYLDNYDDQLIRIKEYNPNFYQEQAIQNPRYILFSTDLKDFKVWLPHTGHKPNVGFRLTVPRKRLGADIHLSEYDKRIAFAQSEYVMRESVEHAEDPDKAFHDTRTMIVMTGNYDVSRDFALELVNRVQESAHRRKMRSWLSLPDREIIIGQTNGGHITKIGNVEYKVKGGELVSFEDKAYNVRGQRV